MTARVTPDPFDTPATEIKRDRWGRPLIKPAGGGKPIGYTRASSLGGALEDNYGLTLWKQRMTAVGVASRRDLVLAANSHREDKDKLNEIVTQAMEAAASSARASIGTSMHNYAEIVDRGQDPGYIPAEFAADLAAYRALTEPRFEHLAIERFCVCDDLQVAGTPDRVSRLRTPMRAPDGTDLPAGDVVITDEKTSGSMGFGAIKFAVQLAVYAHADAYDPATGDRTPWPGPPRTDWALIVWCPAGEGTAQLYWVNIAQGWELARLSIDVRNHRKRKDLLVAADEFKAATEQVAAQQNATTFQITAEPIDYLELARNAITVPALEQVWFAAEAAGQSGDDLLDVCKSRKTHLQRGAA